jgi:hypothetical protein
VTPGVTPGVGERTDPAEPVVGQAIFPSFMSLRSFLSSVLKQFASF